MMNSWTYSRRGLHGAVVHDIGVRILSGDLKPGDPLPVEDLLGDAAGVSRTVVREAIKVLAAKRLVEPRPKTGTRVRPRRDWNLLDPDVLAWQVEAGLDGDFLEQALELRRIFEPAAARLAATRATDEELAALRHAYEEMIVADDFDAFIAPDLRFHALVLEASHNELLERLSSIFGAVLRTLFLQSLSALGGHSRDSFRRSGAKQRHKSIVTALEARDPEAAERAVLRLIDDADKALKAALRPRRPPRKGQDV